VTLQKGFEVSEKSWSLNVNELDQTTWDLSVRNPNAKQEAELRDPKDIIAEIIALDKESEAILAKIQELV
jgi:type I restriction enzyme M protein